MCEDNHLHLLVNFPPLVAGTSWSTPQRRLVPPLRQEFHDLVRHYWQANELWSGSYFAGTVGGAPLSVIRQYIEQQDRPV